jgi:hypothetical protein
MRLRGGALQQPPFATNRVTTHLLSPSEIGAPERVRPCRRNCGRVNSQGDSVVPRLHYKALVGHRPCTGEDGANQLACGVRIVTGSSDSCVETMLQSCGPALFV